MPGGDVCKAAEKSTTAPQPMTLYQRKLMFVHDGLGGDGGQEHRGSAHRAAEKRDPEDARVPKISCCVAPITSAH